VKQRARRLRERGVLALRAHLDAEVGGRRRVLAETHERGRTEPFTPVQLSTPAAPGTILDLRIIGHDGRQLLAG
jgi:threonylcarbamoyladenosine tRNA methylthiotransferase MtaB